MNRQPASKGEPKQAGARIPDKPRDCGPNVDTWPILDEQSGDAPKPRSSEQGRARPAPR